MSVSTIELNRNTHDLDRFQAMMSQTQRRAYSMALQLTHNPSDAEDLVQETFVKAWRGFDSYVEGRPFLNWVLRIMQRAYLDSRRRDNPIRRAESLNSMISPGDGELQELPIPAEDATPDEAILAEELRREIRAALAELPDVYRTAIVMCDVESLSYSEIAEVQATTIGTVRSRIHRGRRLLRGIILRRAA